MVLPERFYVYPRMVKETYFGKSSRDNKRLVQVGGIGSGMVGTETIDHRRIERSGKVSGVGVDREVPRVLCCTRGCGGVTRVQDKRRILRSGVEPADRMRMSRKF